MLITLCPVRAALVGRAAIDILDCDVDEVLLAEVAFRFGARGHGHGQRHHDAGFTTFQDLRADELAAKGNQFQLVGLRLARALPRMRLHYE